MLVLYRRESCKTPAAKGIIKPDRIGRSRRDGRHHLKPEYLLQAATVSAVVAERGLLAHASIRILG